MSTSNHIVKSDPSEGSISVDAGVGGNQSYYPSIASSLQRRQYHPQEEERLAQLASSPGA